MRMLKSLIISLIPMQAYFQLFNVARRKAGNGPGDEAQRMREGYGSRCVCVLSFTTLG